MKLTGKLSMAAGLCLLSQLTLAGVVVIVSADSPVANLTAKEVADIFLSRAATFPDGSKAEPVDQAESSTDREKFYTLVAGKDARQLKSYWSKLMFSGKGQPPKELGSASEIVSNVAADPRLIGYVDATQVSGKVKVVLEAE